MKMGFTFVIPGGFIGNLVLNHIPDRNIPCTRVAALVALGTGSGMTNLKGVYVRLHTRCYRKTLCESSTS